MNWVAKFEDWCSRRYVYWPLVMLLAAATPLAFAPYYHFWLMPLLFGALIRLTELRPQNSVSGAYCFGLVGYAAQFYWIHTALHDISGLPNLYALPLTILLPAYLALYPAACFWLLEKARLPRGWRIGLLLPVLWTLAEFARERAITGFGWGALGYSQVADLSPLAGYAPVGGVHLLTLLCAFCGAWLVLVLHNQGWKWWVLPLVLLISVIVGGWQLRQVRFTEPDGSSATVALAQGNVAQTLKWDAEYLSETMQSYYEQVANSHADITILPETAIPVMRQDLQEYNPGILDQFAYEAQRNGSALAMGIAQYNQQRTGYLNAVINLSNYHPDRPDDIPFYAKNHLVPFGEYKPLPAITEPLYRMMNMPLAGFERGGRPSPADFGQPARGVQRVLRRRLRRRADCLCQTSQPPGQREQFGLVCPLQRHPPAFANIANPRARAWPLHGARHQHRRHRHHQPARPSGETCPARHPHRARRQY